MHVKTNIRCANVSLKALVLYGTGNKRHIARVPKQQAHLISQHESYRKNAMLYKRLFLLQTYCLK